MAFVGKGKIARKEVVVLKKTWVLLPIGAIATASLAVLLLRWIMKGGTESADPPFVKNYYSCQS